MLPSCIPHGDRLRAAGRMVRSIGTAFLAAICLLGGAAPVFAQKDSVVAVGGSISIYRSQNDMVESPWGIGILARLRRHSGLGGTLGLNWVKTDLASDDRDGRMGVLIVRPLMVGPVYTKQFARFALSGSFVVGYSFNGLRHMQGDATYRVADSFACRPTVALWWELGNRWGAMTSLSYLVARPELTTTTAAGSTSRKLNLDAPFVTFGITYGVF